MLVIAYKDKDGKDFMGQPWLDFDGTDELTFKRAKEFEELGLKDVTVFSVDEDEYFKMEEITWSFVNKNRVYENNMKETLGAHLRNLLTPYRTLIDLCEDGRITIKDFCKTCEKNLQELIDFSNCEKMESNLWRDE